MSQSPEAAPQHLDNDNSLPPASKDRPKTVEIIANLTGPEADPDAGMEIRAERMDVETPATGVAPVSDPVGAAAGKQPTTGQEESQTTLDNTGDPYASMSDEEFQEHKRQQLEEDTRLYQAQREKLQQIRDEQDKEDTRSKNDAIRKSADSGMASTDVEDEYDQYRGLGQ